MAPGSQVCLATWTFFSELSPRGRQAPGWTPGAQGAGGEDMAPLWDRGRQCWAQAVSQPERQSHWVCSPQTSQL